MVDEIIFRTRNLRNRLILELMARGAMRVGEVLALTRKDTDERKITITTPKSGRQTEIVFIPQKLAYRLRDYISQKAIQPNNRIFPITYTAARMIVKKAAIYRESNSDLMT